MKAKQLAGDISKLSDMDQQKATNVNALNAEIKQKKEFPKINKPYLNHLKKYYELKIKEEEEGDDG